MLTIAIWMALLHRCPPKFIGTLGECCRMSLPWHPTPIAAPDEGST